MDDQEIKQTVIEINSMILDLYTRQIAILRLLAGSLGPGVVRDALQSARTIVDNSLAKQNLLSQTDPKSLKDAAAMLKSFQ